MEYTWNYVIDLCKQLGWFNLADDLINNRRSFIKYRFTPNQVVDRLTQPLGKVQLSDRHFVNDSNRSETKGNGNGYGSR